MHKFQWEQELISAHFEKSKNGRISTATDIMLAMNNAFGIGLNNVKTEKALTSLKYQRIKHPQLQCVWLFIKKKTE